MMREGRRIFFGLGGLGLLVLLFIAGTGALVATPGSADELARFTCERPKPWEAGVLRNVSIAARQVDSVVLASGAEFSFNRAMLACGSRLVAGTSFLDGREVKSRGGGICQVSSGLYNAAQLAGIEVLERNSHSLYDPTEAYVLPGRDAMVSNEGHSDFRFRNSTAADLTIRTFVLGGRLTVVLLGRQRGLRRRRWVETGAVARQAAQKIEKVSAGLAPGRRRLARTGFDGLTAKTRICSCAPESVTHCAQWQVDRYERVDELWNVGPGTAQP